MELCMHCYKPIAECECRLDAARYAVRFVGEMDDEEFALLLAIVRNEHLTRMESKAYTPQQEHGALSKLMDDIEYTHDEDAD